MVHQSLIYPCCYCQFVLSQIYCLFTYFVKNLDIACYYHNLWCIVPQQTYTTYVHDLHNTLQFGMSWFRVVMVLHCTVMLFLFCTEKYIICQKVRRLILR